ncbi:hypothetical protein B0H17DRAFT_1146302 [Mycena rosella]|uniref:Uncharacterized protein n=1 Tax=Mycena rosella TaxID=1033263 RepID=A0AAD7CPX2_MYCRO|nr:hypothetical protein B0H17DRAFT_1146302 [Mycena rosella]
MIDPATPATTAAQRWQSTSYKAGRTIRQWTGIRIVDLDVQRNNRECSVRKELQHALKQDRYFGHNLDGCGQPIYALGEWQSDRASGDGANDWESAQVFTAALNSTTNIFSVLAVNNAHSGEPPPGLLAAIKIKYSDGPSDILLSDSSWTVAAIIPSDFPAPSDTSQFTAATGLAPFGSGSWGSAVTVPPPDPNAPTLLNSSWIWSTSSAATNTVPGFVGFRKTFSTPGGRTAQSATALITADDRFVFYLNGAYVVSPHSDFHHAQQFTMELKQVSNTFTVIVQNLPGADGKTDPSPAGFIATIRIKYLDGSSDFFGTDTSWLSGNFTSVTEFLSTPDSALGPTFAIGIIGDQPWGPLGGISNVLAAAQVPVGPYASGTMPSTSDSSSSSAGAASDAHIIPIAVIVGASAGGLVLILVAVGICWALRRRNARRRVKLDRQRLWGTGPGPGGDSDIPKSSNTSGMRRPEMARVQSQGATSHRHTSPPSEQDMQSDSFPNPYSPRAAEGGYSQRRGGGHPEMSRYSFAATSYSQRQSLASIPVLPNPHSVEFQPTMAFDGGYSQQEGIIVATKFAQEHAIWQRNAAAAAANFDYGGPGGSSSFAPPRMDSTGPDPPPHIQVVRVDG